MLIRCSDDEVQPAREDKGDPLVFGIFFGGGGSLLKTKIHRNMECSSFSSYWEKGVLFLKMKDCDSNWVKKKQLLTMVVNSFVQFAFFDHSMLGGQYLISSSQEVIAFKISEIWNSLYPALSNN